IVGASLRGEAPMSLPEPLPAPGWFSCRPTRRQMKLDKFDLKILQALQTDGRLPTARLADELGLTSSPTWERVRRLEEAGILRGYHADVAIERLAQITHVIVPVALESHRAPDFRRFEQGIAAIPEIVECWAVGGEMDYVLR